MAKLINISEASSIALHSLAIIANSEELVNASKIADISGFSKHHTAKVMNILVKNNYLSSIRGPKGGFKLSLPPEEITMMEILELIDGTVEKDHCFLHTDECPFEDCIFGKVTSKLTAELIEYFNNHTVKNFIKTK